MRLHRRGWPIVVFGDRRWRWEATGRYLRLGSNSDDPPCRRCGERPTLEGHDACLGEITGSVAACCGHGWVPGYVLDSDGTRRPLPKLEEPCDHPNSAP